MDDRLPTDRLRWVEILNTENEQIPAFAAVRITNMSSDETDAPVWQVAKANADGAGLYLFAGPFITPALGRGVAICGFPVQALYDTGDGTPANGEIWGPGNGAWELRKGKSGYKVHGTVTTETIMVEPALTASANADTVQPQTQTFTANADLTPTASQINIDANADGWIMTLLDPANVPSGSIANYTVTNTDPTNYIYLNSTNTDLTSNLAIAPGDSIVVQYSGTATSFSVFPSCCRTDGSVAAAGSTQGTAALLLYSVNVVSGADGTKGVILDANKEGDIIFVQNAAASNLKIYPQSGGAIDALGTNNPYTLAGNAKIIFWSVATGWFSQAIP